MANPFEQDDFDKEFSATYVKSSNENQDTIAFLEQQIEDTLQKSLASTNRSLAALQESEEVGVNTAQDLVVQREKLQNVEQRLSSIQDTTRQTQRHLNSVKSVFGSIRNYFSKDKGCAASISTIIETTTTTKGRESRLPSTLDRINEDAVGLPNSYSAGQNRSSLPEATLQSIAGTRWGAMNEEIEDNLGAMESNLRRLKELGLGLGEELKEQNELIDSVARKADRTNLTVDHQNRQMKRLLGDDKKGKKLNPFAGKAEAEKAR